MPDGIYITKSDFNTLLKKVSYLEDYIKNSMKERRKALWMSEAEAMEAIGCKKTKLRELRQSGEIKYKDSGKGRNIMYYRESIDKYSLNCSTLVAV